MQNGLIAVCVSVDSAPNSANANANANVAFLHNGRFPAFHIFSSSSFCASVSLVGQFCTDVPPDGQKTACLARCLWLVVERSNFFPTALFGKGKKMQSGHGRRHTNLASDLAGGIVPLPLCHHECVFLRVCVSVAHHENAE